ncbi:MORN repeat-containing protein, partial [Vibrio ichthyoenteri ATCC 700023]
MHFYQAIMTTAAVASVSLTSVSAQASQKISSLMIEIRQQDGISFYYSIANGMTLNGDITIVRDNQGYTVGQFSQGVPNGLWQVFLPNNQKLLDGQYVQGHQDGQWQLFDSSGNLSEKQHYRNGVPDGLWEQYNHQGTIDQTTLYKNGQKEQV